MCNEYHTTGYADTIVIYFVDIVEGIDKQGPDSKKQFESDIDLNVAALVARMCLCIWGLDRVIILDSSFSYVRTYRCSAIEVGSVSHLCCQEEKRLIRGQKS